MPAEPMSDELKAGCRKVWPQILEECLARDEAPVLVICAGPAGPSIQPCIPLKRSMLRDLVRDVANKPWVDVEERRRTLLRLLAADETSK